MFSRDKRDKRDNDKKRERRGSRSTSRPPQQSGNPVYPKPWGQWTWDETQQRNYRGREIAEGKFEYDYGTDGGQGNESSAAPSASTPQEFSQLANAPESSNVQYPPQTAYPALQSSAPEEGESAYYAKEHFAATSPSLREIPETSPPLYAGPDNYTHATSGHDAQSTLGLENLSIRSEALPQAVPPPHATNIKGTFQGRKKGERKEEKFDRNYRVQHQREYTRGRVLKVLWSEPQGHGNDRISGGTLPSERVVKGERVYAKVRRFVIIKEDEGHCLCLPIMTYGGQGTLKHGVHQNDHGIIFTSENPVSLPGEVGMNKTPIRVDPATPQHKLDAASRLNYAKVYTIECNVKVWFIGKVHRDSLWYLLTQYNNTNPPLVVGTPPPSHRGPLASSGSGSYSGSRGISGYQGQSFQHPQHSQYQEQQPRHFTQPTYQPNMSFYVPGNVAPVYPANQFSGGDQSHLTPNQHTSPQQYNTSPYSQGQYPSYQQSPSRTQPPTSGPSHLQALYPAVSPDPQHLWPTSPPTQDLGPEENTHDDER